MVQNRDVENGHIGLLLAAVEGSVKRAAPSSSFASSLARTGLRLPIGRLAGSRRSVGMRLVMGRLAPEDECGDAFSLVFSFSCAVDCRGAERGDAFDAFRLTIHAPFGSLGSRTRLPSVRNAAVAPDQTSTPRRGTSHRSCPDTGVLPRLGAAAPADR